METQFEKLTIPQKRAIIYRNIKVIDMMHTNEIAKLNAFEADRDELATSALVASVLFSVLQNHLILKGD